MKRLVNLSVAVATMMVASAAGSAFAQNAPGNVPNWPHSAYAQNPWSQQAAYPQTAAAPAPYAQTPAYAPGGAYPQAYNGPAYEQTQQQAAATALPIQEPATYGQSYSYPQAYAPQQTAQTYAPQQTAQGYAPQPTAAPAIQSSAPAYAQQAAPISNVGFESDLAHLRQKVSERIEQTTNNVFGTAYRNNYYGADPMAAPAPGPAPAPAVGAPAPSYGAIQHQLTDPSQFINGTCDGTAGCSTGCDSGSCDTCCDPCCRPCSFFYAGAEIIWMQANFQENVAIVQDPVNTNIIYPFDYDREIAPRLWFGYTGASGAGFRARYWEFDHDTDIVSLTGAAGDLLFAEVFAANTSLMRNAFAGPGETLTAQHSLELRTIDVEATSQHYIDNATLLLSFGARYARMDQFFRAEALAGGVQDELVEHKHSFEGWGPTLGMELTRPFGSRGLAFYANARGSVLFGDVSQDIFEVKMAGAMVGSDHYDGEESLSIGELGFGLQWQTSCGQSLVFVRGGYEGQIWLDAGGPLRTRGDMTLDGIVVAAGFQR